MKHDRVSLNKVLERLGGNLLLKEFAKWLCENEYYDIEDVEELLCETWDGAYPSSLLGEDLLLNIGDFLDYMAEFAVEKVFGEKCWNMGNARFRTVPNPSYEDYSSVYVLEMNTRSILAVGCDRKTWHYDPNSIKEDLENLIEQLKEAQNLMSVRFLTSS